VKNLRTIYIAVLFVFASCSQLPQNDLNEVVDHYEIIKTFNIYHNKKLIVDTVGNTFKINEGNNDVLEVKIENKPVFKPGKSADDLYSYRNFLFELNPLDSLINTTSVSKSKLYRQVIAMSPSHGIRTLKKDEKIEISRIHLDKWKFKSQLYDFEFNAELSFATDQMLQDKIIKN